MPYPENLFLEAENGFPAGTPDFVKNNSVVNGSSTAKEISDSANDSGWSYDFSNSTAKDYLDFLKEQASKDEAWFEKYINALQNESQYSRAVEYDKWLRSNSYQMMVEDLKKAGLNPYLALNSLGGSSGTSLQASSSGMSAVSGKSSLQNALTNMTNSETKKLQVIAQIITALITGSSRIIGMSMLG